MDKTYNISLGGFAFQIDDRAYQILKKYLNDIRLFLKNTEGVDEIISDVEYRMAELLKEKMSGREVVNTQDVDFLIERLGTPEQYDSEEISDDTSSKYTNYKAVDSNKKLFRDPDNKMMGGVLSGIGHYIGLDATWVRLIVVALPFFDFIFLGVSTLTILTIYMILWIVVPEAKTTSEKLQMRGEPVNFDSIKEFFGNTDDVKNNLKDFGNDVNRAASSSGSVLGNIIKIIFKIILIIIIINLFIIAISLLIGFIAVLFGLGVAGFGTGIVSVALSDYMPYLFEGNWESITTYISLGLVILIPAITLILIAMRLISRRYRVPRAVAFSLPALFLIGFLGLTAVTTSTFSNFKSKAKTIETISFETKYDTIYVQRGQYNDQIEFEDLFLEKDGKLSIASDDDIIVKPSDYEIAYMEIEKSVKGRNNKEAKRNLKDMNIDYKLDGNKITLGSFINLEKGAKWREQKTKNVLYLPKNSIVNFKNFDDISARNEENMAWHSAKSQNFYKFDGDKFICINCPEKVIKKSSESNRGVKIQKGEVTIEDGKDTINIKFNKNDTDNIGTIN